ncbi:MAG: 50S ribosomal protein L25/general stress protein Ctc [Bacteroidota bacterium]|nr:50S ribosomal protein L25/general stress protein Ctc [Bacteroidota bacterium]
MKSIELKGTIRETVGKNSSKVLRANETVPCVLYGGKESVHFSVEESDLKPVIYTPNVYLVALEIDGKKYTAKIQDLQVHPVTDKVIHLDFYEVSEDKKIVIELPVRTSGNSIGVKEGGKLVQDLRKLKVKASLSELPDEITIDVTSLGLGKTIRVGELVHDKVEFLNFKNSPVVSVKMTRAARGAAEAAKAGK